MTGTKMKPKPMALGQKNIPNKISVLVMFHVLEAVKMPHVPKTKNLLYYFGNAISALRPIVFCLVEQEKYSFILDS